MRFAFGGTPPVAERARAWVSSNTSLMAVKCLMRCWSFLNGQPVRLAPNPTSLKPRWNASTGRHLTRSCAIISACHHGGHLEGITQIAEAKAAGRDLAGHRPGCPGQFLPSRAPGPAPNGRGRRAGAQPGGLPRPVPGQPAGQLSPAAHLLRHG